MATVFLPRSLVALFPDTPRRTEAAGATLADLIADLDRRVPGIENRLCDGGSLRQHLNVFVDGERASLATPVAGSSVVHIIPAISGG